MSSNKSFSTETSERYALALFELSKENSELDIVEKNVSDFLELYSSSEELENFVKNPTQLYINQIYFNFMFRIFCYDTNHEKSAQNLKTHESPLLTSDD